jgi:dipeptidyl aminopeptidase/acylaminoacyl peptidase
MPPSRKIVALSLIVVSVSLTGIAHTALTAQQAKKPFTIADEIQIAHFGDPYYLQAEGLLFSPDGAYFAVDSERGHLDLNCVEDTLSFYRSQDAQNFLKHADDLEPPSPVWVLSRSGKEGPIIRDWRWLADSSGVGFLELKTGGNQQLVLADLQKKKSELLTSATESVVAFDIRDRQHYVYTEVDAREREKERAERRTAAMVGTGHSLFELILPDDPRTVKISSPQNYLWAIVAGKRFQVKHESAAVAPEGDLVLSPAGESLVTKLRVLQVPVSWETLYPPPFASDAYRITASQGSVHQWVRINLQTGSIRSLTDAPTSDDAGWFAGGKASWSLDGKAILLPDTFIQSSDQLPSRPCVAVVDLGSNKTSCVEMLKGHTETGVEEGYHRVNGTRFVKGNRDRVEVIFTSRDDQSIATTEYRALANGTWQIARQLKGDPKTEQEDLKVTVKQGLNEPPLLVATNKQRSRVIWDPNPQLKNIELTEAAVYKWKDNEGREWKGGLYKPRNYKTEQLYPLVIQTHGFAESEFRPSGVFPTAYAARALAAMGIMVLQVPIGPCPVVTPDEGPCVVSGYEAAVHQLALEGLVDPHRVGLIGFSWPCFHVMEALTTRSLHIIAASVTDGAMTDYFQYLLTEEGSDKGGSNLIANQDDAIVGAAPFGIGLQKWLSLSPTFRLDEIHAPLLVFGEGPFGLLYMWGPYAALRYLHKPVDLIMLNTDEHVLTNPAVRMASQGGSLDWFRFWLQGYEDPDPSKIGQYNRWRTLRQLQEAIERQKDASQAASD